MVFHIFDLSGLEQAAFFHNLGQMKEALPLNSLFNYFETTPFSRNMSPRISSHIHLLAYIWRIPGIENAFFIQNDEIWN